MEEGVSYLRSFFLARILFFGTCGEGILLHYESAKACGVVESESILMAATKWMRRYRVISLRWYQRSCIFIRLEKFPSFC